MQNETIYAPGKTVGIVGGGQLGRMLVMAAKKMGLNTCVLDPTPNSPAGQVSDKEITRDFLDPEGYQILAEESDVITYEFEHVSADMLAELENNGSIVRPGSHALKAIQNKGRQKEMLKNQGIPVPRFEIVSSLEELNTAVKTFSIPLIVKTLKGGYDGKGNLVIHGDQDLEKAKEMLLSRGELLVEEYIDFDKEVSIMAARDLSGNIVTYPVVENEHEDDILRLTKAPAELPEGVEEQVQELAHRVLDLFDTPGIFGIECFLLKEGQVYINEIAPRVHNSGHYTIEACTISQFDMHLRSILGLPLANPVLIRKAWMINLLGSSSGDIPVEDYRALFETPEAMLHLYGKKEVRPQRKIGHITVTGETVQDIEAQVRNLPIEGGD